MNPETKGKAPTPVATAATITPVDAPLDAPRPLATTVLTQTWCATPACLGNHSGTFRDFPGQRGTARDSDV